LRRQAPLVAQGGDYGGQVGFSAAGRQLDLDLEVRRPVAVGGGHHDAVEADLGDGRVVLLGAAREPHLAQLDQGLQRRLAHQADDKLARRALRPLCRRRLARQPDLELLAAVHLAVGHR